MCGNVQAHKVTGATAEAGEERRLHAQLVWAETAAADVARLQSQAADVVSAAQRRRHYALRRQATAERTLQQHLHNVEQVLQASAWSVSKELTIATQRHQLSSHMCCTCTQHILT